MKQLITYLADRPPLDYYLRVSLAGSSLSSLWSGCGMTRRLKRALMNSMSSVQHVKEAQSFLTTGLFGNTQSQNLSVQSVEELGS